MKHHPIIFAGEMVRAILDGRKTQTRQPLTRKWTVNGHSWAGKRMDYYWGLLDFEAGVPAFSNYLGPHLRVLMPIDDTWHRVRPPFEAGDRLWVREAYHLTQHGDTVYQADARGLKSKEMWRMPRLMPRPLSRITLEVTGVRIQRVQDISEADAMAEGVDAPPTTSLPDRAYTRHFRRLWGSIYGPGAWKRNDWVAAYTFERVEDKP